MNVLNPVLKPEPPNFTSTWLITLFTNLILLVQEHDLV